MNESMHLRTSEMYERAAQPLEAEVGDEILTLDSEAGKCFGFNSVAASVWRRLAQPASFDELRQALLDEYDVSWEQCTADLTELLDELTSQGLIRRR